MTERQNDFVAQQEVTKSKTIRSKCTYSDSCCIKPLRVVALAKQLLAIHWRVHACLGSIERSSPHDDVSPPVLALLSRFSCYNLANRMRIAVAGARGSVGQKVVQLCIDKGHFVYQINRSEERGEASLLRLCCSDLLISMLSTVVEHGQD